jgi:hypothetical protein
MRHDDDELLRPSIQLLETRLSTRDNGLPRVGVAATGRGRLVRVDGVDLGEVNVGKFLRDEGNIASRVARLGRVFWEVPSEGKETPAVEELRFLG